MAIERVGTHNTNREIETVRFMYSPLSALSKLYTLVNVATYKSPLSFSILCSGECPPIGSGRSLL